jgi:hypothetical protein
MGCGSLCLKEKCVFIVPITINTGNLLEQNMNKLQNPIMVEIDDLYKEYERLRKVDEGDADGRQAALYNQAGKLFESNLLSFSPEEMINGFKYGTDFLQSNIAEMMISEQYFYPDYIPVMRESVEEDGWPTSYLFIRTLQEHLAKDELIEVLKQSLHSDHLQVRWHSMVAVKEENLPELKREVRALFNDPDSKLGRYAKRIEKSLKRR